MRKIKNINQNWFFNKEQVSLTELRDVELHWESVCIPHTWNAFDGANGNDYYQGVGWYRKELNIAQSEENNRIFIEFQGVNSVAELYLNEQYIGQHKGGYSTFRFDITEEVRFGEKNILFVKVDNAEHAEIYPLRADFTFYGGIYRDVNLIFVNPDHIDLEDFGSDGIYIEQEEVSDAYAKLRIKIKLKHKTTKSSPIRLWLEILDATSKLVAYSGKDMILEVKQAEEELDIIIDSPRLWNGIKDPYLYTLKVSLQKFNDTIDQIEIPFGVRYFHVDPAKGFFLNGEPIRLNGVSRHQDRMDKGWAISKEDQMEDMSLIKEIGATSIRLAHYQHDQFFYDLCDQEGMVVWAEIPFITEVSKGTDPAWNAKQQLKELIRQNYNHPSIFFWGIQNEIQIDSAKENTAREIVKELNTLAKNEDSSRLTTMANVLTVSDTDEYNYMTDVIGFNKYYGWYMGKTEDFADWIDQYHQINPNTALAITEYGAEGIVAYHSENPTIKDYTEEYHALFHEKVWKIFSERPFLWGTYVWNMFDFGANVRDEGGVKGRNNKGLVTFDRQIKKDAFYFYKANWSMEPFVHIAGKRYIERSSDTTSVKVYTNCPTVTLTINQKKFATQKVTNGVAVFREIPLEAEENWLHVQASDTLQDMSFIKRVVQEPQNYKAPVDDVGENVQNWFIQPELDQEEVYEDVLIPDGVFSSRDTIEELMTHEETRKCMIEVLGDLSAIPMYGMMKNMKIDTLMSMDADSVVFNKKRINKLNQALTRIPK